jgi:hypothetical protein
MKLLPFSQTDMQMLEIPQTDIENYFDSHKQRKCYVFSWTDNDHGFSQTDTKLLPFSQADTQMLVFPYTDSDNDLCFQNKQLK